MHVCCARTQIETGVIHRIRREHHVGQKKASPRHQKPTVLLGDGWWMNHSQHGRHGTKTNNMHIHSTLLNYSHIARLQAPAGTRQTGRSSCGHKTNPTIKTHSLGVTYQNITRCTTRIDSRYILVLSQIVFKYEPLCCETGTITCCPRCKYHEISTRQKPKECDIGLG